MDYVDLRSDTVTQPTPEMREAMARAEVGDDVYGEDPTVNRLQELAAERMGKEAGLFVPSGAMGNLTAIMVHCGRGDEMILGDQSHPYLSEAASVSALGGIQPRAIHNQPDGTLDLQDIKDAIREEDVHHPVSRLVSLENTQNQCNGVPLTAEYTKAVGDLAHANQMALHIDGARIFNAAVALGVPAKKLVSPADSISFCLSKGLCAPVGSVLTGSKDFMYKARRIRKQLGGGMRQAGILAAAGIVALEKMVDRLAEDHARAKKLELGLGSIKDFEVPRSYTNIVRFQLSPNSKAKPAEIIDKMKRDGVLVDWAGPRSFRLVTHYGIDDEGIEKTLAAFNKIFKD